MRNTDVIVENLQAISDLCKQGNLPDNAEDVVNFDNELATTQDIQSAADIAGVKSWKKWTTTKTKATK
jgi:trans-2-enoyl-CoA reductase